MYPVKTPQDYLHCLNWVSIQKMYIYERYNFLMFEKILNFSHILKIMSIVFSRRFADYHSEYFFLKTLFSLRIGRIFIKNFYLIKLQNATEKKLPMRSKKFCATVGR